MITKTSIKSKQFFHSVRNLLFHERIPSLQTGVRKYSLPWVYHARPPAKENCIKNPIACSSSCSTKENRLISSLKQTFGSILGSYHPFFRVGQKQQYPKACQYLEGIFCVERGKRNIERMIEEVQGSKYESLQHFISHSKWDTEGLMKDLALNISKKLQPYGKVGCTVDEKAHLKKGTKSVGVGRQYAGTSGKV